MPQGEPSHAEMIAALELAIERLQIDAEGHEEPAVRLASALVADNLRAVRAHLERTQPQPIDTAPRDGSDVVLDLGHLRVTAFWCKDLKRWVLCRPLHMESVHEPEGWFPPSPETP